MNTVSNSTLVSHLHKSLMIFILVMMASMQVFAQQCTTLNFAKAEKNNQPYVAMIVSHNGEFLERTTNKRSIINGEHSYYLEAGEHAIVIEQWPEKIYRRLRKGNRINKKYNPIDITSQSVYLILEAGRHYQIEFVSNKQPSIKVIENKAQVYPCETNDKPLMQAREVKQAENELENMLLPTALEYRLRRIMTKLDGFHQFEKSKAKSNYIHANLNPYIGTTIDNEYHNKGSALKVLSILPYSLASKLKLMSGDIITHLDGKKIKANDKTPDQQLSDYFGSIYIGKAIEIDVMRNGKQERLSGLYQPIILPDISYQLFDDKELNNFTPILRQNQYVPAILHFELNQLILEIKNYYQSKNYSNAVISINRDQKLDVRVGLSGNRIKTSLGIGLKLAKIEEDSFAQSLGLLAGDIITNINTQILTEKNIDALVASLSSLKANQEIQITVSRNGENITLSEQYIPHQLIAFNLMIDLRAIDVINEQLANASKYNKHQYRKRVQNYQYMRPTYWQGRGHNKGSNSYSGGEKYTSRSSSGNN